MRACAAQAGDLLHGAATRQQRVGYQGAMATPRHCFGAHDGSLFALCQCHEPTETMGKLLGLHMVGKTAKTGVAPCSVDGICASTPQPS